MDESIKIFFPWVLLCFWLLNYKLVKKQRMVTIFFTVFAGFSANFTAGYREIYQGFSILLAILWLIYFLRHMKIDRWNVFFLAFYGVAFFSLLIRGFSEDAISSFANLTLMFFVTNYLIFALRSESNIKTVFDYVLRISTLMAIAAIFEYFAGMRSELTFSNPNYFAVFLIPGLAWSLLSTDSKANWFGFALISFAIYATGSRSALFSVPIVIAFYYLKSLTEGKQSDIFRMVFLGIVLAALAVTAGGGRILNAGREDEAIESSDRERIVVIEVGFEMLREHPLIGVGWGKFAEEFGEYSVKSKSFMPNSPNNIVGMRDYIVTHNDYIRVFSELGIIGFSIFMMILLKSNSSTLAINSGLKYPLLAMMYGVLFFSVAHNNMNSALFWFLIMLPLALRRIQYSLPKAVKEHV